MPAKKFLLAVVIATLIWAPVYLMPGVVLGAALTFEKQQVIILVSCIVIMAVSLWLLGGYVKQLWLKRRAQSSTQEVTLSRHSQLKLTASIVAFLSVIVFLVSTTYGALMIRLSDKILGVIG